MWVRCICEKTELLIVSKMSHCYSVRENWFPSLKSFTVLLCQVAFQRHSLDLGRFETTDFLSWWYQFLEGDNVSCVIWKKRSYPLFSTEKFLQLSRMTWFLRISQSLNHALEPFKSIQLPNQHAPAKCLHCSSVGCLVVFTTCVNSSSNLSSQSFSRIHWLAWSALVWNLHLKVFLFHTTSLFKLFCYQLMFQSCITTDPQNFEYLVPDWNHAIKISFSRKSHLSCRRLEL